MNNSETCILLGDGHLPKKAARIGERHDATLVNHQDPQCTCGYGCPTYSCRNSRRHWFAIENYGEPFTRDTAEALRIDLLAAKVKLSD